MVAAAMPLTGSGGDDSLVFDGRCVLIVVKEKGDDHFSLPVRMRPIGYMTCVFESH